MISYSMPGDTLKQACACKLQIKKRPPTDPSKTLEILGKTWFLGQCRKRQTKILRLFGNLQKRWENVVSEQPGRYVTGEEAMWTPAARPAITAPHC